jgi:glycine betaine/proline transport system permease protein
MAKGTESIWEVLLDPFQVLQLPVGTWVENLINWLVANFRHIFMAIRWPVDKTLDALQSTLLATPPMIILLIVWLVGWQMVGMRITAFVLLTLAGIGVIGAWQSAMTTVSLVLTAVIFCVLIGVPLGVLAARNDRLEATIRPVLDAMQTTPPFVYLVPIVMLFGIGNVPGVVVTIIFALAPIIRLTNLGLRQVPASVVEAALAFGASERQLLFKVQIPLALRTIMAGLNQTLMMSLSMVVIASMIAVGGLGQMVLRGIGRLDMALATVGGLGIVLLAIGIDRMTQALSRPPREKSHRHWYDKGPAAILIKMRAGRTASK